jgi:arylsulfatase A-like enzyme
MPRIMGLLLAVFCLSSFARADAPAQSRKPNILFIVADDLGYADIGAQGIEKDVRTPNIDALAKAGVRFTNGYVSCPVCSPSRAGFLTGRYQERFGHESNPVPTFENQSATFGLPLNQTTIAAELKKNGYVTGAFGKWHEGTKPPYRPQKRGFDEFFGFLGGAHSYTRVGIGDNALREGDTPVPDVGYLTDAITDHAVAFIDHHKSEPFFLYVPYNAVHTPQEAPPKYTDRFPEIKDHGRKLELAMLSAEDDGVGKILARLHDAGLDQNTLVVYFSDNGGPTWSNFSVNTPLRGYKGLLWEGGIRIPFMIRWTDHIPAGQVRDEMVISLDLFPTALAAAGIEPRKKLQLDGVNLLPWLEKKTTESPHQTLYWRMEPQWAIRDGNFKLVSALDAGGPRLFDLSKDIGEKQDLMKEKPEIASRLKEKYDAWNAHNMRPLWPEKQEGRRWAKKAAAEMSAPDSE